ncbi:hypothetical protein Golob_010183 [Gossypium lobatum]|uniref:Uncharacterized protein n=1 Tax=Gossypium lobatum TaxID=34289 RepID=A0A7J8MKP2_9ROSI|nr:hypothetical protein [Gossypium lobatum]
MVKFYSTPWEKALLLLLYYVLLGYLRWCSNPYDLLASFVILKEMSCQDVYCTWHKFNVSL